MTTGSIYKTFGTDPSLRADGVWVEFAPNSDGSIPAIRLARMSESNPRYQKKLEAYAQKFQIEIKHGILSEEQAKGPFIELFAETIILDWKNFFDADGNPWGDYTSDKGVKVCTDLPDFYAYLREKAQAISSFRNIEVQDKAGN